MSLLYDCNTWNSSFRAFVILVVLPNDVCEFGGKAAFEVEAEMLLFELLHRLLVGLKFRVNVLCMMDGRILNIDFI